jgi:hypothetical protein
VGTSTVRPDATLQLGSHATVTGAANAHTAVSDATGTAGDADGSYVDITASGYDATRGVILDLPNFTIPANARITGVRVRMRARDNSGYPFDSLVRARPRLPSGVGTYGEGVGVASNWGASSMTYYQGATETRTPFSAEWTATDLNNLQILLTAQTQFFGSGGRVAEVWVDALYDEQPVVTVTAPAESAVLATSMPQVGYTYSDPDGSPLNAVWVRIFNQATYGGGGFNPDTSPASADSGWIGSSNPGAWTSTSPLPNDTYRAYVKARQAFGGGYFESAWDFNTFSVNIAPPPTPTVDAPYSDTPGSYTNVVAYKTGGTPATEGYEFQYSDNVGATWHNLRFSPVAGTGDFVVTSDHEAPPNRARAYRARSYRTASGVYIYSPWASAPAAATVIATRWRLSDPLAAGGGMDVVVEGEDLTQQSEEPTQVLHPLGRRNPVVVSGKIRGEVYQLTFVFDTEAKYLAFEALRNTQRVLLLKSARNWMAYIKLVGARTVVHDRTTGDAGAWWYTVSVTAVEQDRP